jgi:hypothetical protein
MKRMAIFMTDGFMKAALSKFLKYKKILII